MKKDHRLNRLVTTNLTLFQVILLGTLLVLTLSACGSQPTGLPVQTSAPFPTDSTVTAAARTPQPTRPPSRYATRTPTSGPPQPTPTPAKTLDVLPDELTGQEIAFWHPWQGGPAEVLQEFIDQYNRANRWGVHVEVHTFDGFASLEAAFVTSLAAGDPPSLLVAYDDRAQYWDQGGHTLVNLQSYASDPVWGLTPEEQADFNAAFWQQGVAYQPEKQGGVTSRQLSIPLHRSELVFFYNQSWAAELGYDDLPVTPSDLRRQACAAAGASRADGASGTGGLMLSTLPSTTPGREILLQPEQLLGWIGAFGGQVSLPDGAGYQFNTPAAQRALEFLKDLHQEGCVHLTDSATPAADFAARRGLLYLASTADMSGIQAAFSSAENPDAWVILPFPTADGAAGVVAYGPSLIIPQTGRLQQLAAWTLLEWLVEPQKQARWVQALDVYPTRFSTIDYLGSAASADPAWAMGLELLSNSLVEPSLPSWSVVRWMMGDALAELFSADFTAEQIPALLEDIDLLAAEIDVQAR